MKIEDALRLVPGMKVRCPEDQEEPPYVGFVVHASGEPQEDLLGAPFAWITVREEGRAREAVWPSNLLTLLSPMPEIEPEAAEDLSSP
jgi:hypothetical protein